MRIGVIVEAGRESDAGDVERHGLFGALVGGVAGAECTAGAFAAATTRYARIVVRLRIGTEHPVTLAEEVSVLDNITNGRVVVVADVSGLDELAAAEDVGLLRRALASTPLRHRGPRWTVPAGLPEHSAPDAIMVTPPPAQVEVPVWALGDSARACGVPIVRRSLSDAAAVGLTQPGILDLSGDRVADRTSVRNWADAGVTHLFVRGAALEDISRYLQPEVGMVQFPRLVADAAQPMQWKRPEG